MNSLEGNVRTMILEMDKCSTLLANAIENTQYAMRGMQLIKYGAKNAEALGTAAAILSKANSIIITETRKAIETYNSNITMAQQLVGITERESTGREKIPVPTVDGGVGYAKTHQEGISIFARRGVVPAISLLTGEYAHATKGAYEPKPQAQPVSSG
ncbi:hypothetical protein HYU18_03995 [Candidatus Woesearchaeota archaeon]|nr:hypothetical protein [Candidatus Woesearchaeota archaeon]